MKQNRTKSIVIGLVAISALVSGCVVAPEPPHREEVRRDRDRDHDGVPNRADRDRDGDGVRNRNDRRPDNPYRN